MTEEEDQDDLDLEEVVKHANYVQEAIATIKRYEGILKSKNKVIMNITGNQEMLPKRFRKEDEFLDIVD